ncbi:hypothetical protein VNI00_004305 [Paramarasmius palmivorus]|uniref:DUF6534 domain-containing protein n=1 Tax=Paramarasmius palmivorus TaxID=297713 RepID=A0AAW0DPX7_9AGAR
MLTQMLIYFKSFSRDSWYIKSTVWLIFGLECISSTLAITTSSISLGNYEHLLDQDDTWLIQGLSTISGLVAVIVHCFYAWRIRVLGGHIGIIFAVLTCTTVQCTAVIIAGNSDFLRAAPPAIEPYIILWLISNIICDTIITVSLVVLLRNAITLLISTRIKSKVGKVMTVAVETGMITVFGALFKLVFFLICHKTSVHYVLFYLLPKLYANCMLATLNIRLDTPETAHLDNSIQRAVDEMVYISTHKSIEAGQNEEAPNIGNTIPVRSASICTERSSESVINSPYAIPVFTPTDASRHNIC